MTEKGKYHEFRPGIHYLAPALRPTGIGIPFIQLEHDNAPPNGLPVKPYVYRGTGVDTLTAWMDDEPADIEHVSPRQERLEMFASLRLWEGTGGDLPLPGFITVREAAEQLGVSARTIERYKRALKAGAA